MPFLRRIETRRRATARVSASASIVAYAFWPRSPTERRLPISGRVQPEPGVERHARKLDALTKKDANGRVLNRRDPQRVKAARRLARAKEREANARRDWLHKASRDLVDRYGFIALESLKVGSMTRSAKGTAEAPGTNVRAKSGLNRALLDAGFGMLATLIREKAAHAARVVVSVDPKYTSQTCAQCAHVAKASREGARFACVSCGHEADADVNAARVILLRAESPPTRAPGTARGRLHDAA